MERKGIYEARKGERKNNGKGVKMNLKKMIQANKVANKQRSSQGRKEQ